MKKIITTLLLVGILGGVAGSVLAGISESPSNIPVNNRSVLSPVRTPNPSETISVQNSATTTATVAKRHTIYLDSQFTAQGSCIAIKDASGTGYTYLTVEDGVGTFSLNSCE